ncbi:MAG TPA: hypothetical protein VK907_13180 [Phnomibacter sp.]|nr:hypothetical protein [Phnomibacter sp.]
MTTNITRALAAILCLAIIIASCRTTQLAFKDAAHMYTEVYPVKGRQGLLINQRLSFGDYTTEKVDRSWTKGSTWTIGPARLPLIVPNATKAISYNHIQRKQTLRFAAVSSTGQVADVYAATHINGHELQIGDGKGLGSFSLDLVRLFNTNSSNLYYVQIYIDGSQEPWQLVLDNENSQMQAARYVGYLYGPNGRYYQLKPVQHLLGKNGEAQKILMGSVGFEILDEAGTGLAAVSAIDKGQVYMGKNMLPAERFLIENLCAALLLQQQI